MSSAKNRNLVDPTLLWTTRLQMWSAGFKLRLLYAIAGGVFISYLLFAWKPPQPVDMFKIETGMKFTLVDGIKLELARQGFTWLYPSFSHKIADLPEEYHAAGVAYISAARRAYWNQFRKYGYAGFGGALLSFLLVSYMGRRESRLRSEDQYVRGAQGTTAKKLSKLVKLGSKEMGEPPPRLQIGGVAIACRDEITPWNIIGRPQVGKSTAIKAVIDQIIELKIGKRIIFDSKGDYTESHLQPGDYIFAPSVDNRSIRWTIFNDITSLSRISDMVAALIPEGGKDPMWALGARCILEGLFIHCWTVNQKTNAYLWQIACKSAAELKEILAATPGAEMAAALLDKPDISTSFSFTVNLKTYLKPIQLLARMDGPFSIREWLVDGKKDGLFVASTPDHQEVLKPLMNLFISTLLTSHKSLPDDRNRRCFYILDELCVLPKIPGLADAMNFGPSKGLCIVLGYQSYQQIDNLYGRDTRDAMISAASKHLIFSVGSDRTCEELSKLVGTAEVIESRGTLSTGITDAKHGGSSMDQLVKKCLVMPDDIKDLQPLSAILKILGYPAAPVEFVYVPYPKKAEAREPDPTFDLDLYLAELAQLRSLTTVLPAQAETEKSLATETKMEVLADVLM